MPEKQNKRADEKTAGKPGPAPEQAVTAEPTQEPPQPTESAKLAEVKADAAALKAKVEKLNPDEQKAAAEEVAEIAERESSPSKEHLTRLTATLAGIVVGSASLQKMHKQQLREYAENVFLAKLGS